MKKEDEIQDQLRDATRNFRRTQLRSGIENALKIAKLTQSPEERAEVLGKVQRGIKIMSGLLEESDIQDYTSQIEGLQTKGKPPKKEQTPASTEPDQPDDEKNQGGKAGGDPIPIYSKTRLNHFDELMKDLGIESTTGRIRNDPGGRHGLYDSIEKELPGLYKFLEGNFPQFRKNRKSYKLEKEKQTERKTDEKVMDREMDEDQLEETTKRKLKTGDIKMKPEEKK